MNKKLFTLFFLSIFACMPLFAQTKECSFDFSKPTEFYPPIIYTQSISLLNAYTCDGDSQISKDKYTYSLNCSNSDEDISLLFNAHVGESGSYTSNKGYGVGMKHIGETDYLVMSKSIYSYYSGNLDMTISIPTNFHLLSIEIDTLSNGSNMSMEKCDAPYQFKDNIYTFLKVTKYPINECTFVADFKKGETFYNDIYIRLIKITYAPNTDTTPISAIRDDLRPIDNSYYTLNGTKVEHPTKGIYIKNGKKVYIK